MPARMADPAVLVVRLLHSIYTVLCSRLRLFLRALPVAFHLVTGAMRVRFTSPNLLQPCS
jgi:hypothetical protein